MKFSDSEIAALIMLRNHGGILMYNIPDKNEVDSVFREITPGIKVYKKLETKGLVLFTEEEPQDDLDGFTYTPTAELTDTGLTVAKTL